MTSATVEVETKQGITKDMTLGEIVKNYPSSVEIIQGYGLHCVGCSVAFWETLEQGIMSHNMPKDTLDKMLVDLNKAISNEGPVVTTESIVLTKKAAEKVLELSEKAGKKGYGLKLTVVPGGCSGSSYGLAFAEKPESNDKVFEERGVRIFVDKNSLNQLSGVKVDYVDALEGAGFKISNPNATSSCGCGQSFA